MKKIIKPTRQDWPALTLRPAKDMESMAGLVEGIFKEVKEKGDEAVKKYTRLFDGVNLPAIVIDEKTIADSSLKISPELKSAMELAKNNIEKFHASQAENVRVTETVKGVKCWRESRAVERAGIYIPGGSAPLFSTVLMLGIPARLAGCREIVLCTPPAKDGNIHPAILYAASLAGINKVCCAGGIQAIAALTFGTESISKADKIFGPGNQYVTAAKQMATSYGVAIDMPAGPSELLIIADAGSNPVFVAADLLSQAEHGDDSQVILLSDNETLIDETLRILPSMLETLPRKETALAALENSSAILLDNLQACMDFSNSYAPEHLILACTGYRELIPLVSSAGSVFLGNFSCESAGDYASGTNHTLPTNGYARSYSGVSLDSFLKKITFQELSEGGLQLIGPAIEIMAEEEGLAAHKKAVTVRLDYLNSR